MSVSKTKSRPKALIAIRLPPEAKPWGHPTPVLIFLSLSFIIIRYHYIIIIIITLSLQFFASICLHFLHLITYFIRDM